MSERSYTQDAEEHLEIVRAFTECHAEDVGAVARVMAAAVREGGQILFFGNGGSAAQAQHLAAELVNRIGRERPAIAAIALNTDTSVITSIANDHSYDRTFARQIEALGRRGDIAFALSTSGESPNISAALETARERGLTTIGLLGRTGGRALGLSDHALVVPSRNTARIQEVHILVGHHLCEALEALLYPETGRS